MPSRKERSGVDIRIAAPRLTEQEMKQITEKLKLALVLVLPERIRRNQVKMVPIFVKH